MRTNWGCGLAAAVLLLLTAGAANAATGIKWVKTFAQARQQAKKMHKLIMLDFYTDW